MLVLSRKPNQSICIGNNIHVTVVRIKGNTIQLGIDAPKDVHVVRSELLDKASSSGRSGKQVVAAAPPSAPESSTKSDEAERVATAPNIHLMPSSANSLAKLPNLSILH